MTTEPSTTDSTQLTVDFSELFLISTGGIDVFALNWNQMDAPPPYSLSISENEFSYQGHTYLVNGHGAILPQWVQQTETENRLAMFVERDGRLLAYASEPTAETSPADSDAESAG